MALEFEFTAGQDFHFTTLFAARFNAVVANERVTLPEAVGTGIIREVALDTLSICHHQHQLREALTLKRLATTEHIDILTIKFEVRKHASDSNGQPHTAGGIENIERSVELSTSNLFGELTLPAEVPINMFVINITRQQLISLLHLPGACSTAGHTQQNPMNALCEILHGNPSFVLHESMTPDMERILTQLNAIDDTTPLPHLLYKTKAQELLYLLLTKILHRPTRTALPIHQADAEKIYAVRTALLNNLREAPTLPALATEAGMSLTRMKVLFRQVFGDSIYNYYQAARMDEAARLLTQWSVSETGYHLGFTNLSHFTRLFERHHSIKPKRYKDQLV